MKSKYKPEPLSEHGFKLTYLSEFLIFVYGRKCVKKLRWSIFEWKNFSIKMNSSGRTPRQNVKNTSFWAIFRQLKSVIYMEACVVVIWDILGFGGHMRAYLGVKQPSCHETYFWKNRPFSIFSPFFEVWKIDFFQKSKKTFRVKYNVEYWFRIVQMDPKHLFFTDFNHIWHICSI